MYATYSFCCEEGTPNVTGTAPRTLPVFLFTNGLQQKVSTPPTNRNLWFSVSVLFSVSAPSPRPMKYKRRALIQQKENHFPRTRRWAKIRTIKPTHWKLPMKKSIYYRHNSWMTFWAITLMKSSVLKTWLFFFSLFVHWVLSLCPLYCMKLHKVHWKTKVLYG